MLVDAAVVRLVLVATVVRLVLVAAVVRLVLVTAGMELLGTTSWWLPRWLDRLLSGGRAEALGAHEPPASTSAEVR